MHITPESTQRVSSIYCGETKPTVVDRRGCLRESACALPRLLLWLQGIVTSHRVALRGAAERAMNLIVVRADARTRDGLARGVVRALGLGPRAVKRRRANERALRGLVGSLRLKNALGLGGGAICMCVCVCVCARVYARACVACMRFSDSSGVSKRS